MHNGIKLELQAVFIGFAVIDARGIKPLLQTLYRLRAQFFRLIAPCFCRKSRQDGLAGGRHVSATLGNNNGVVTRLGQISEQGAHFGGGFETVIARQAAAVLFRDNGFIGNAQQRIMRFIHAFIAEIDIVRGDQRHIMAIGEVNQIAFDFIFRLPHRTTMMARDFNIEPIGKQAFELIHGSFCRRHLPAQQQAANNAISARR